MIEPRDESEVRSLLVNHLFKDTIGPSWVTETTDSDYDEELILTESSTPAEYYLTGYLRPVQQNMQSTPTDPDTAVGGSMLDNSGKVSGDGNFMQPSSMGCTVKPQDSANGLEVTASWGIYRKVSKTNWKRTNHQEIISIDLSKYDEGEEAIIQIDTGVELYLRVGSVEHRTVTLRLVNKKIVGEGERTAEHILFQPQLKIHSEISFLDVRKTEDLRQDPTMEILYCHSFILALGHNVGVDWGEESRTVFTTYMPSFEIPVMRPDEALSDFVPSIGALADSESGAFSEALDTLDFFVQNYTEWIAQQDVELNRRFEENELDERLRAHARSMVSSAQENVQRISSGIEFLRSNALAALAFRRANRAIQFSQNEPTHPDISSRGGAFQWRPFQLAFILLNLKGLCALSDEDDGADERGIVDLAWFPTGGGKTEAYLGLIAMIGFYRRLRNPEQEKETMVHTVMRYTLRLLTSDQADRIVRLMGAMNYVQEIEIKEGDFPRFRLGMWVGAAVSPNDLLKNSNRGYGRVSAEESLDRLMIGSSETEGTILQFEVCPWCGDDSDHGIKSPECWSISEFNGQPSLIGICPNEGCLFSEENGGQQGIPFTAIDDDIYLNPPTVLLATADKFARLAFNPWAKSVDHREESEIAQKHNCRTLFAFDGRLRPPDLIIQDELHLLTGPLGTTAGLIESTMDVLWKSHGHKPKYVAATATIRGADKDVQLMYGRDLNVFPPPVAEATDNFFAREDRDSPGRVHTSILGPPNKARTVLNQPMASLLQRVGELQQAFPDMSNHLVDPYHTLVAYFNSLRELGGAQASLPGRIAAELIPRFADESGYLPRELMERKELTSRRTSSELKEVKSALKRSIEQDHCVDTVVTTNMFQVGIDIPRLGLMAIVGQPKSNSEYIQSSGRVGRRKPGLVVSLLRSTFPRDQSHFENFRAFHQELYRHVDMTSTTPFSQRSLDRGAVTVLTILLRMGVPELTNRKNLGKIVESQDIRRASETLRDHFTDLIEARESSNLIQTPNPLIQESVNTLEATWSKLIAFARNNAQNGKTSCWQVFSKRELDNGLVGWFSSSNISGQDGIEAMNSLRDVADEVLYDEKWKIDRGEFFHPDELPEGHLFSQASPGSLWEKDGVNYLTMGINLWDNGSEQLALQSRPTGQWMKEDAITPLLPPNLRLRFLPTTKNHGRVAVQRFPYKHGLRCTNGHLIDAINPDRDGRTLCTECGADASPTRFISICSDGHLHPFDYFSWVHNGKTSCNRNAKLKLNYGPGASYSLNDWVVECTGCGQKRDMGRVPWITEENGPQCQGWRPWLGGTEANEKCDKRLTHVSIGSTAVSFAEGGSLMLIPLSVSWGPAQKPKTGTITEAMKTDPSLFETLFPVFESDLSGELSGSDYVDSNGDVNKDKLKEHILEFIGFQDEPLSLENVRSREAHGILTADPNNQYDIDRFNARSVVNEPLPEKWSSVDWPVKAVSRLDRITELKYQTGLTRGGFTGDDDKKEQPIDFRSQDHEYGTCRLHYGEGLYFELKPEWIEVHASRRKSGLSNDHASMQASKKFLRKSIKAQLPNIVTFPGASNHLTILHTFSHLLIKELCTISGYSLGSIRERLYIKHDDNGQLVKSGILLYTSGPSSDGTLGGLVRQGTEELSEHLIGRAIEALLMCSNDPVCYHHQPTINERNGAACHSCVYLPETSCEFGNMFLDRRWA